MQTLSIEAVYENGVLKPAQPLPLQEHEKVHLTIQSGQSRAQATYGQLGWKGDVETLRRIAEEDEFGILESP
jgi:predicted DNA-binding antitoxin AbrB/MazE fold protein